ncbi:MAG: taurine catabolism dioxygenase TauD [Blastocatellia bacterium]|nr:MAG: taurine catabolism dioxygenase TauD [Blastocatellia bacterium]
MTISPKGRNPIVIPVSSNDIPLPPPVRDASAWYGSDLAGRNDWIEHFSETEIAEIERAVRQFAHSFTRPLADSPSLDLTELTTNVSLPNLAPRLQGLLEEVLNGRGFVLMKGLPIERWSKREAAIAFLIIGVHLGNLRMQNAEGHLLGHVKDLGRSSDDPNTRIYQTRERQTHHTDSCDVVGLLCLRTAKRGGLSSLVSSTAIFNEMHRRRPDLLRMLLEPIETDRRGEVPEGSKPYFNIPVFNYHDGLVSAIYQRQYIESARRFTGVAPLSPQQIEALDLLDDLANDQQMNLMMELEPGDIQLVHNHTILHDRTAFEDYTDPERKRHLLRLWVAPTGARRLPEVYADRFGSITPGDRGGVTVSGATGAIVFESDKL